MALRAPLQPNTGRPYVASYERRGVEALLVGLWNDGVLDVEEHVEEGMPRAKANPSHLGGTLAGLIDVRRAVEACTNEQTLPILRYHYGGGLTQRQIAPLAGISQATVSRRLESTVSAIVAYLNGEDYDAESD